MPKNYQDGKLPLSGFQFAVEEIKALLDRARKQNVPVWFVRHQTRAGAAIFDPGTQGFQIVDELKPQSREFVLDKTHPSAFVDTNFKTQLDAAEHQATYCHWLYDSCLHLCQRALSQCPGLWCHCSC